MSVFKDSLFQIHMNHLTSVLIMCIVDHLAYFSSLFNTLWSYLDITDGQSIYVKIVDEEKLVVF